MAFYAGVLGSLSGQAQGKQQAYEDQIKQATAASAAAQQQSQFDAQLKQQQSQFGTQAAAQANADQTAATVAAANIAHTKHQDSLDDVANGIGVTPFRPRNFGQKDTANLTLSQRADNALEEAHYWRSHGASVKADAAEKEYGDLTKLGTARAAQAEKAQADANHLIEILGRVANWNAQQKIALQRIASEQTMAIMRDQTTESVARQRIAAAGQQLVERLATQLKVANLNANQRATAEQNLAAARLQVAQITSGGANWRAMMGQGLEQLDPSGNPVMPSYDAGGGSGGGGTTNVFYPPGGVQVPSVAGSAQPQPGLVQPPPIGNGPGSVRPPAVNFAPSAGAQAGAVQPPPVIDVRKATQRAVNDQGVTIYKIGGRWVDGAGRPVQ